MSIVDAFELCLIFVGGLSYGLGIGASNVRRKAAKGGEKARVGAGPFRSTTAVNLPPLARPDTGGVCPECGHLLSPSPKTSCPACRTTGKLGDNPYARWHDAEVARGACDCGGACKHLWSRETIKQRAMR